MHCLLLLESIGTSELLVILVVALIVFGPRKLPELGRSLGRTLRQLQSASDDFKRTWEAEASEEAVARVRPSLPNTAEAAHEVLAAGVPPQESQTCLPT